MPTILAIETSTAHGSIALWSDGALMQEWSFESDRTHNSLLFAPLGAALALASPDLVVVGTGPGSYSGMRVALSAALGISMTHGVPLIGWPSLTAFELTGDGVIIGNARRGSFFIADIIDQKLVAEPRLVEETTLLEHTRGKTVWSFDETSPLSEAILIHPSATWLARRAATLSAEEIAILSNQTPEPLYLRAPFITTPKPRRVPTGTH